jgi:hypothetical protein
MCVEYSKQSAREYAHRFASPDSSGSICVCILTLEVLWDSAKLLLLHIRRPLLHIRRLHQARIPSMTLFGSLAQ